MFLHFCFIKDAVFLYLFKKNDYFQQKKLSLLCFLLNNFDYKSAFIQKNNSCD